jgi:predicted anti-sigma-YlaC factor YlaD
LETIAVNKVGDALASGNSVFETDNDIALVGDALPFALKMTESLLAKSPRHRGLLQTACQGFATYSYLYVQDEADRVAETDIDAAERIRARARRLYLRAHEYGFRAMDATHRGAADAFGSDPNAALATFRKKSDVPLLYWNAAALGLAVSVSKGDARMLARLPEVEAFVDRALALDDTWQAGTLHEFMVILAGAKPGKPDFDRIENHYRRALELSDGKRASLYVAYAESVSVARQDKQSFEDALKKALAVDPEKYADVRLLNVVARRRAEWLLSRADELILTPEPESGDKEKGVSE